MITVLKSIFTSDGIDHRTGTARELSIIVKGNPVKQVKVGVAEVKSNYNVENGFVRRYNPLEYGESDLTNTYANVSKNSYIHSINIDENFDANNITSTRLNRDGHHESLNSRLYTVYYTDPPLTTSIGDWPSPVFLKTAQTTKNGNLLVIGTKGSTIKFYDNSSYSGDPIYLKKVDGNITAVYNLLPKTTYYYRVLDSSNNILFSDSFTTEGNTRFIRLPQVHNVRDCGGWKTIDKSKRFKLGLIFRGALFDSFYSSPTSETLVNVANELKQLNVKLIIDLRGDSYGANVTDAFNEVFGANGLTIHRIGADIVGANNIDFTNLYSDERFQKCFFLALKALVEALLKNQSVYIHCQQGRDRTGGFMAILLALCDISENGIIKDYELTSSCTLVTVRKYFYDMWTGFKNGYSDSDYPTILSKILEWFIQRYNDLNDTAYIIKDSNGNYITNGQIVLNTIKELILEDIPLKDMTIGVIGDSFSSYSTWKPVLSEVDAYSRQYPKGEVQSPTLMWWYKVANTLGMVPEEQLSVAAWSGSFVSDYLYLSAQKAGTIVERSASSSDFKQSARPASSPQRIKHLSNKFGGVAPDIIICEIGSNDAMSLVRDETVNRYTVKTVEGKLVLYITESYLIEYYTHMLDNIISLYPKAKIFCINSPILETGFETVFGDYWNPDLVDILSNYPLVTLIDILEIFRTPGSNGKYIYSTSNYTVDESHPNDAGHTKIANIVSSAIINYYLNLQPEPQPQEDDVYITQINDNSFTGSPTINGGVFTWPLKVTLSDGTVTTYANYRSNHSNYGDATSLITGDNAKAPNEGYIDSNGNLTYDLSKDNYVLDSTYLGTVTLPCLTNGSNTVTKDFSKIQKCAMTNNSTPFDSYIANNYTFTTVSSYELSYHLSGSGSDPDIGTFELSNWPQSEKDDYSTWHCAKNLSESKNCVIRITNSSTGLSINNIAVLNTNVELSETEYGTANGIFTDPSNNNGTYKANVYSRSSYSDTNSNCKLIRVVKNQKAYIRNKTNLSHSYLVVFGRDDLNCLIEIGTPKTSS